MFKTEKEFIGFVSNVSGTRVNLINETAYLKPHTIYGMMNENVKLKFEVVDKQVNVINVGGHEINDDRIQKIIDDICLSKVSSYTDKSIFPEFKFETEDGNLCYLQTSSIKPIDRLRNSMKSSVNPTENSLSKIKDILNKSKNKKTNKVVEEQTKISENKKTSNHLKEQFEKLNKEKESELESKIQDKENAILKVKNEIKFKENEIDKIDKDLQLTKRRLNKLKSGSIEFNNYFFHIDGKSENETKVLDFSDETKKVMDKICKGLKIEKDLLIKNVFSSCYKIHLTKKEELDVDVKDKTIDEDILNLIYKLDLDGEFVLKQGYIEYWGDIQWHELNNGMESLGFKLSSEFTDKIVQNNVEIE